ncbi:hypothetical protein A8C75_12520 [Marinobacterium aestuarii]|uniref:Winged helix-turn helix domain-containing protein n=1 Tax=Marinobacterium aestuarii TaxID=1821621 RepID=A0A1A9EZA9_9GAMM|nr:hypothetical protein A8C75_12520 [Marinobacterium aestuarii]
MVQLKYVRPSGDTAQLIKQFWGIDIPVRTLGDYLKRWGFSPQKPLKKAWEQNPTLAKRGVSANQGARQSRERADYMEPPVSG